MWETTRAAFVVVHHASKGIQAGKQVTDVGAGAGAQSRATDSHIVLRPHEEDNAVVVEAAVRSFAPVKPVCLRWEYPIWTLAPELDPEQLRQEGRKKRVKEQPDAEQEPAWTPQRFADSFIAEHPSEKALVMDKAKLAGLSVRQADSLIRLAVDQGIAYRWEPFRRTEKLRLATVPQPLTDMGENDA